MTTKTEPEGEVSEFGALMKPVQPYIEKYGSKVVLALAAVLLLAAIYIFWTRSSAASAAAGWGSMATANAPEDFADIADDNPGTAAASWARLSAANGYLSSAVKLSFTDREASSSGFKKARDEFDKLLNKRGTPKDVRERALYGIARLEESTTGDDTSTAVAAYEKILSEFPESAYKATAEKRIAKLKSPETQRFYGWFANQKPSVTDELIIPNDLPDTPGSEQTGAPDLGSILKSGGVDPIPGAVENAEGGADATPPADPAADAVDPAGDAAGSVEEGASLQIPKLPGTSGSGEEPVTPPASGSEGEGAEGQ